MDGYLQVPLKSMLNQYGEDKVKAILSSFYCPINRDVESFLRDKSILVAKQNIAPTHLVFASYKGELALIGYYTLTTKVFFVPYRNLNSKLRQKIKKFGMYNEIRKGYEISAPLIAQLGKNFRDGLNNLITGDELLKLAVDKIGNIQEEIGGKVMYLECEDHPKLIEFYKSNGFISFGKRNLDRDEKETIEAEYLLQMLKYR